MLDMQAVRKKRRCLTRKLSGRRGVVGIDRNLLDCVPYSRIELSGAAWQRMAGLLPWRAVDIGKCTGAAFVG